MTDQDRLAEIAKRVDIARGLVEHQDETAAPLTVEEAILLVGEVERLRGLLRQLEWMATLPVYGDGTEAGCPVCQQPRLDGHAPTCWLAAELV